MIIVGKMDGHTQVSSQRRVLRHISISSRNWKYSVTTCAHFQRIENMLLLQKSVFNITENFVDIASKLYLRLKIGKSFMWAIEI